MQLPFLLIQDIVLFLWWNECFIQMEWNKKVISKVVLFKAFNLREEINVVFKERKLDIDEGF